MMHLLLYGLSALHSAIGFTDTTRASTRYDTLAEVKVQAFYGDGNWKTIPASVAVLNRAQINTYAPGSIVPVLNLVPGVRMEERSPVSYRFSIRGSLLRSPFGVRNTKVYWNGFPLSDAGGNTYLNLVDIAAFQQVEVLKGPAASAYGAGTGGALLLREELPGKETPAQQVQAGISAGSYGMFGADASWQMHDSNYAHTFSYVHRQGDGYRQQSASRKDIVHWLTSLQSQHHNWEMLAFYSDIYYQTPGGLTLTQMQQDPHQARPPSGIFPGAVQQQAAIYNQTIYGALSDQWQLRPHWQLNSFVMANHTAFKNPFITNYETRSETNAGLGAHLQYKKNTAHSELLWTTGIEWLYNKATVQDNGNKNGEPDTLQFRDLLSATQWFAFTQAALTIADRWELNAGVSWNHQGYQYQRVSDPSAINQFKRTTPVFTPRISVGYRVGTDISLYALASKGFSPPSLAEIRPSDGNYYGDLQAEYGWNLETGIKGYALQHRLKFDLATYFFRLQHAIVRRVAANGAEYFVNAGNTRQNGLEAMLRYQLVAGKNSSIRSWQVWSSYSYQPYRFVEYQQSGVDYSGNALTGVPVNNWISGTDIYLLNGWQAHISLNCTARIPLNDANTFWADKSRLLQASVGYEIKPAGHTLDIMIGADNLLNEVYSLGNDLNAVGNRFYNPSAPRNFYCSVRCRF